VRQFFPGIFFLTWKMGFFFAEFFLLMDFLFQRE